MRYNLFVLVILVSLSYSCRKKIEIREIEKKYSWTEVIRFTGTDKIFLSSGSNAKTLFFQQPFYFTALTNQNENSGIMVYGAGLPTDLTSRMPISPSYSAFALSDTVLKLFSNSSPYINSGRYINLKAIDPTLTAIQRTNSLMFKTMAIDSNGVLLLAYNNNRPSQPLTFMMIKVKTSSAAPYIDTIFSKIISVPNSSGAFTYTRYFAAAGDYFLADLTANGIYKFSEDGSFLKVHNPAAVDVFYEWHGQLYAHAEWNKLFISSDKGNSWQDYNGITNSMVLSNYYTIKDSLIGVVQDNIYTLNWNNTNYSQRLLQNDGLEGSTINGLEILNDTVYAATTKGLYFKPVSSFFKTK